MLPKMDVDIEQAQRLWAEYEQTQDLSGHDPHDAVGIDAKTGEVFFGKSAKEITLRLFSEGRNRPLFFRRVGRAYYGRKSQQRVSLTKV